MPRTPLSERTQVFRSASVIGFFTLVSRILGMARDVMSASLFGAGWVWDSFIIAWTVPNLFRRLFGEGALSSTFIPVYTEAIENGPVDRPARVVNRVFGTVTLIIVLIVALGVAGLLAASELLPIPDGFNPAKARLTARLSAVMLPYLLFISLAALLTAVLNVHKRFGLGAANPALLNAFWMGGLAVAFLAFPGNATMQIYAVSVSLVAGGVAQFAAMIPQVSRIAGPLRPRIAFNDPDVRKVGSLALPIMFGLAVLQLNTIVDRLIAELLVPGDGAVSALYYGNRLMQFPLGLVGVAVSTAAFPLMSRLAARGDMPRMRRALAASLRGSLFLSLPAGMGLAVLAEPVVRILFGHGAFRDDPNALSRTASVLAFYAAGVPLFTLLPAASRAFYALKDTRTPTRIAFYSMLVNLSLNLALVGLMRESGLALATTIAAAVNVAWLVALLKRRGVLDPVSDLVAPALKVSASTLLMGAACFALWEYMPILRSSGFSPSLARLMVVIGAGALVFFLSSIVLKDDNLAVLRRRGGPAPDLPADKPPPPT